MRTAVSGTGRIGRLCIRRLLDLPPAAGLELAAVNTSCSSEALAHLLEYDTVHGRWHSGITAHEGYLLHRGRKIELVAEREPSHLPWGRLGIELVIDATGAFTKRSGMESHLAAGARRVLLTSPGEAELTAVMGVNESRFDPNVHRLVSAASCTTNCLAPVLKLLHEAFGVRGGWATSIHAFTNDQNHMDNPHRDLRRARACTSSIIPAATGVSKALKEVLPELASLIQGTAVRVPVADVSLLQLQLELGAPADETAIRSVCRNAAAAGPLAPYVGYSELPLVSADYIGCEKSAVVDGTTVLARGSSVQLSAWYDNEWGYACRVIDLAEMMACRCADLGSAGGKGNEEVGKVSVVR
ncbi:type I glyceraldehyde-3-phosphate dehydrogenase [Paenibacillus pasadenensis]|uniref:type I glyceraldehyde-3-phosphate dehydrogenase n=1 Tax=Paenibacillus pasadenensis TaxID=217090 RepID=UPI00203C84FA|nr:glyceraldehyde 3-phosphate dehydrogenase NAD-binding domain-containing protein [Paenibacillus pasadenensis]MCM3748482.1 type I glyceraldehyde-3-phosphate dehydrogenase [Paenibacillus pasadenensis]